MVKADDSPTHVERELFLAALEKTDAGEREAFLDNACGEDAPLRARIEELLQEQEDVGSFLAEPVWTHSKSSTPRVKAESRAAVITEQPGDQIGQYTLMEKIG